VSARCAGFVKELSGSHGSHVDEIKALAERERFTGEGAMDFSVGNRDCRCFPCLILPRTTGSFPIIEKRKETATLTVNDEMVCPVCAPSSQ
jgi:hypothetical protein